MVPSSALSERSERASKVLRASDHKLLLDTHVFLWWRSEPERIREEVRETISGADAVFVSVASAWEVGIKKALGRLRLPAPLESGVIESGFEKLPITFAHAELIAGLPQHHRDPFDRMLVAQAISEGLVLVTHDARLEPYEAKILWT